MEQTAKNKAEFLKLIHADSEAHAEKMIFKGTSCGAWISFNPNGIAVGSIVEGVDECPQSHDLSYPITISTFWEKLAEVDDEASTIWTETHGCDECGPEDWNGYRVIRKDCPACKGQGIVI